MTSRYSVLCMLVAAATVRLFAASQQPNALIFHDYDDPPTDLAAFAGQADAIVVARVDSVNYESVMDSRSARVRDVSRYLVTVLDVLKPSPHLTPSAGTIAITRPGGRHEEAGVVVRSTDVGFEEWTPGVEYVLFLTWNSASKEVHVIYGPSGCFEVTEAGGVRPFGPAEVATRQRDKSKKGFIDEIRLAVKR